MGEQCLHVCCDCLRVIALFCDVMFLVDDWAALSAWIGIGIGYGWTYAWEVAYFGSIYPPCDVDRFLCRNEGRIQGLEVLMMAGGDDVIRFLVCAGRRVTAVGVVSPGMLLILVIGLLDCVGGPSGRYDWLDWLSWGAWLADCPMGVCSTVAVFPGE